MPFDAAGMDLEKAMGRVAESSGDDDDATAALTVQCVTGGLERHHALRLVRFCRRHRVNELSLFRCDLGTYPDATDVFLRYVRTASATLFALRLRSVMLNAGQTRALLRAAASHGRLREFVYDGAALHQVSDELTSVLVHNAATLTALDVSCESWALGDASAIARGLAAIRRHGTVLTRLCVSGCQLTDAHARPLLETLSSSTARPRPRRASYEDDEYDTTTTKTTTLTHLEMRANRLRGRATLPRLAALLVGERDEGTDDTAAAAAASITTTDDDASESLRYLDLASNPALFATDPVVPDDEDDDVAARRREEDDDDQDDDHAAVDVFCAALRRDTGLRALILRNCGVTVYAAERLAHALTRNTTLRALDLRRWATTTTTTTFPQSFMDSMARWKGLETLDLDFKFTPEQATAFVTALERNTSLVGGRLEGFPDATTQQAAAAVLARNAWWARARRFLDDGERLGDDGGVAGCVLSRCGAASPAGTGAAFCILRERLPLWLESRQHHDHDDDDNDSKPHAR